MAHGIPLLRRSRPSGHSCVTLFIHHFSTPLHTTLLLPPYFFFFFSFARAAVQIWIGPSKCILLVIPIHFLSLLWPFPQPFFFSLSSQTFTPADSWPTPHLILSLFLSSYSARRGWWALKGWWSQGLIAVEAAGSLSSRLTGSDPPPKIFSLSTDFFFPPLSASC